MLPVNTHRPKYVSHRVSSTEEQCIGWVHVARRWDLWPSNVIEASLAYKLAYALFPNTVLLFPHAGMRYHGLHYLRTFGSVPNTTSSGQRTRLGAQRAVGNALDKAISQYRDYSGYGAVDELAKEAVQKAQAKRGLPANSVPRRSSL